MKPLTFPTIVFPGTNVNFTIRPRKFSLAVFLTIFQFSDINGLNYHSISIQIKDHKLHLISCLLQTNGCKCPFRLELRSCRNRPTNLHAPFRKPWLTQLI